MSKNDIPSIEIALSPCPNDVFIVSGLILKTIEVPLKINFLFADIETLNNLILDKKIPLIKASFAIWDKVRTEYQVFPVGAALGFGVGPLIVGIKPYSLQEIKDLTIAIPGKHTTAHFIFDLFCKTTISYINLKKIFVRYDEIIPLLVEKKVELGLLIHEGRFVYKTYGLYKIQDLGEFWEKTYNLPLPLGGFFIKRTLPEKLKLLLAEAFKESILWANKNWEKVLPLLKDYAQELKDEVIKAHIETYVTNYSLYLTGEALHAVVLF